MRQNTTSRMSRWASMTALSVGFASAASAGSVGWNPDGMLVAVISEVAPAACAQAASLVDGRPRIEICAASSLRRERSRTLAVSPLQAIAYLAVGSTCGPCATEPAIRDDVVSLSRLDDEGADPRWTGLEGLE